MVRLAELLERAGRPVPATLKQMELTAKVVRAVRPELIGQHPAEPAAVRKEIPSLIKFIAPKATYEKSLAIIEQLQEIQQISPLAALIEPGAGMERQIEITEALIPYAGTGPGLLPPGVELPKLPDLLGGAKNAIIIGAVAIGGMFLLSRFIGRSK